MDVYTSGLDFLKEDNPMECKITNDLGTIFITEDVLLRMAGYAALECYGIVAMSSKRARTALWSGSGARTSPVACRSS